MAAKAAVSIGAERIDWGKDAKRKYGRYVGVVYLDGEDVNEELVRLGHATGDKAE